MLELASLLKSIRISSNNIEKQQENYWKKRENIFVELELIGFILRGEENWEVFFKLQSLNYFIGTLYII